MRVLLHHGAQSRRRQPSMLNTSRTDPAGGERLQYVRGLHHQTCHSHWKTVWTWLPRLPRCQPWQMYSVRVPLWWPAGSALFHSLGPTCARLCANGACTTASSRWGWGCGSEAVRIRPLCQRRCCSAVGGYHQRCQHSRPVAASLVPRTGAQYCQAYVAATPCDAALLCAW